MAKKIWRCSSAG
ncbi:hypothetical protein SAMN04515679_4045 [Pelosinus fermentans]|nr:hypothetical protein SAMN04515679_4045 [Pelosinus fermentans]